MPTQEIETKILDVNSEEITAVLAALGAGQILQTRLVVDWIGPKGLTHNGDDPWYLRVRTGSGKTEVTWKSLAQHVGNTRQSEEITFFIDSHETAVKFLLALNFENYAHQEKDRTSWMYKNWRFDLDQYPGMPAYLEIEGESEEHVAEALVLLHLQDKKSVSEGERKLIQEEYNLNWNDMRF